MRDGMKMNRALIVSAVAILISMAFIATIMISFDDKKESYETVNTNEGLLGTVSFDVADMEHSGTWTKGIVFAIDEGDAILLKVIGEIGMGYPDTFGIAIGTASEPNGDNILHPKFTVSNAYCSWNQESKCLQLMPNRHQIRIGDTHLDTQMASGGGSFVVDFKTTDRFDCLEGKIDLSIGAGSYIDENEILIAYPTHETVTIYLK